MVWSYLKENMVSRRKRDDKC